MDGLHATVGKIMRKRPFSKPPASSFDCWNGFHRDAQEAEFTGRLWSKRGARVIVTLIAALALASGLLGGNASAAGWSSPDGPVAEGIVLPQGGTYRFEHLTIEDGLSQNAGLALLQDRSGYLWIGTQDGLNRYDGYSFTVFKHDPEDPNSLSYNSVVALLEDADGRLWIGTWGGGLNRYDPATGRFTRFIPDPADPAALSHALVTTLLQDSSGTIWVGTLGGLDRFEPDTGGFTHFRHDPDNPISLSSDAVSTLFEDSSHAFWIGTGAYGTPGAGLNRFDPATGGFTRFSNDPADPASLAGDNVAAIVEANDGRLWVGLGGFSLAGAGLDLLDPETGVAEHHRHNPDDPASLSADDVFSLLESDDGQLWVGTWSGGLNQMALDAPGLARAMSRTRIGHTAWAAKRCGRCCRIVRA